ncbi:MarR family winged helix-turn-helix transcriptional regulator [Aureimonas psammosilenae]|uniref:MarR family winged helix-turn-helix transcriptional regulator n=1 Tax=Aureimonas psammosilenae TaxID=2495496 RepID=UPI00126138FF|nr:MarR family transcriptional regulator [Aureimonas psammosilenae]
MPQQHALRFAVTSQMDRATRQWRRLAGTVVTAHGISEACALPLITIARKGEGLRQGALAEELGIEGPSLVRLLDQLCAAELVRRCDDPLDRRAKTLRLTEKGHAVTRQIEADLVHLRDAVLGDLHADDLRSVLKLFAAVEAASEAIPLQRGKAEESAA